jgi:hypothetical protein
MLVEDILRNKRFSRFEYHMFYDFYPFVTYLLTPSRIIDHATEVLFSVVIDKSAREQILS